MYALYVLGNDFWAISGQPHHHCCAPCTPHTNHPSKVYLASASPPVRYPNVYGVDMPTAKEFVAYNLSEQQICEVLGADGLVYQSQQDLLDVGRELNPDIVEFEASCFTGMGF